MKKIISAILITTMVLSILSLPAASQSTIQTSGATYDAVKDETVYAVLNFDGSISAVNIVNRINTPTDGTYSDYGLYSAITNLSNTASPRIEGEKINWPLSANEKGFYYSGIVENAQPPFLFGLIYSLDGKTCKAEDLIGKTGRIEMYISINSNINSNKYFTDNFVCQIQIPLSLDLCGNISSEGASAVTVGKTKTLAYTILPGKSKNITIGFDAKNFEMDGITATMSFLNEKNLIDIDTDEIKSGITEMTEGIDELLLGTNKLKDGTVLMADAISDTAVGSQELQNGIGELNNGIDKYTSAVSEINDNTKDVSNALSLLSQNGAELGAGYGQLSTGTTQFLESMKALIATLPPDQQGAYLQQIAQLEGQLEGYG